MSETNGNRIRELFLAEIQRRVLVIDGAMGTAIQALDLNADAFGGEDLAGCNEILVEIRPECIRQIHRDYLEAGADCIETNTFGSTPLVLAEYDRAEKAEELNHLAASLARETAIPEPSGGQYPDRRLDWRIICDIS